MAKPRHVEASLCRSFNMAKPQYVTASIYRSLNMLKPPNVEALINIPKHQYTEASIYRSLNIPKPQYVEASKCWGLTVCNIPKPQYIAALIYRSLNMSYSLNMSKPQNYYTCMGLCYNAGIAGWFQCLSMHDDNLFDNLSQLLVKTWKSFTGSKN